MPAEILVVEDPAALARTVAEHMARAIRAAIAEREWCFLALPAGHFVRPIYEELVHASLDWGQVEFYFSEERGVPADHPASAWAEATRHLLENRRLGEHQFHRIEADQPDLAWAAERYAEELPEAFDLMLYEVGADGHLGALLPNSPAFDDQERPVIDLELELKPRRRVVLAPSVVREAHEILAVAHGADRAEVVARVLEGDEDERALPAALLRERTWVLDEAAASRLKTARP